MTLLIILSLLNLNKLHRNELLSGQYRILDNEFILLHRVVGKMLLK